MSVPSRVLIPALALMFGVISPVLAQDVVPGSGLLGVYFTDQTLSAVGAVHKGEAITKDWGNGSPDPKISSDNFSARWLGSLIAPTTGTYTLTLRTDDGSRLWVGGVLLIDKWILQGPTEWSATVDLVAGEPVPLKYEFYENGGGAVAQLSWTGQASRSSWCRCRPSRCRSM